MPFTVRIYSHSLPERCCTKTTVAANQGADRRRRQPSTWRAPQNSGGNVRWRLLHTAPKGLQWPAARFVGGHVLDTPGAHMILPRDIKELLPELGRVQFLIVVTSPSTVSTFPEELSYGDLSSGSRELKRLGASRSEIAPAGNLHLRHIACLRMVPSQQESLRGASRGSRKICYLRSCVKRDNAEARLYTEPLALHSAHRLTHFRLISAGRAGSELLRRREFDQV